MFEINWSVSAREEYFENLKFWISHNKSNSYSLKIIDAVEEMELLLAENPKIGKKTTAGNEIFKVIILRNFYIYYTFQNKIITVLALKSTDEDFQKHKFGI